MLGGAAMIAGAAAAAVIVSAGELNADAEAFTILARLCAGWAWPALGVVMMMIGRLAYGHWQAAAPIVHVTGAVTRTVGLLVAAALGAMLIFLLVSGFEREDTPAAAALGVGVIGGLLLAHIGVGLRNTQQRYPRHQAVSPDPPE
jgi:hypothetical protein